MRIAGLFDFLRRVDLFGDLDDSQLGEVEARFTVVVHQLGDVVVRRGDEGDAFFVIYAGKARVVDDSDPGRTVTIAVLGPGDTFGEQALINGAPRGATVRASGALTLLRLGTADFVWLTARHTALRTAFEERIRTNAEFNFLRRLNVLAHLTPAETGRLLRELERIPLEPGEVLFREGDEGGSCYLVREGRLDIHKGSAQGRVLLATLGPGALVGEMSLLYGQARSAEAVAAAPTVLLALGRETFERYLGKDGARQAVVQESANRILQNENLLVAPTPEESAARATFSLDWEKAAAGRFARRYPVARAGSVDASAAACLVMLDEHYHRPSFTPGEFAEASATPPTDGLLGFSWRAEERGYLTRLLRIDADQLAGVTYPGVVHRPGRGYAVVYSATPRTVLLAEPASGLEAIPMEDFAAWWDGELLVFSVVPQLGTAGGRIAGVFRQFAPLAREYRGWLLAIVAISLIVQLFGVVGPQISQVIVDEVLVNGDRSLLVLLLLTMLVATGFQLAASAFREYLVAFVTRQVGASLYLRFFQHILALTQAASSRWQTGDYLVRFAENEKILKLVAESGFKIVIDSATIVIYMGLLLYKNASLGGVAAGFIVAIALLMVFSSPALRARDREIFDRRQASESHVVEAVGGIQTIKSLAAEELTFERGSGLIAALKLGEFRFANFSFNLSLASSALNQAATITILGFGATLCLKQEMTTGELVAFNALFGAALAPLLSLVKLWDEMQELRVSLERTGEVLSAPTEPRPPDASTRRIEGRVEFQNVTFRYPGAETDAISGFSLEVLPGQKVAVVGRSGSGKTTLAALLLNLYPPSEGEITIDRLDLNHLDRTAYRRQLGVVEQAPHLFSGTIRENIAMADPGADLERVVAAATLAGAHAFIEQLPMGYDTQIGERGMTLSGGQRQRVVIARTILNNPAMLILDEATSALDTESESLIQRNLESVTAGRTTFIIAHRLSTVRNADMIVAMDQGRLVEKGTHAQLMEARGLYYYLNTRTS